MTYRVKDSAPQVVKDIEAEPETIDVVERNGRQVAVATWRDRQFEEELPRGCEAWEGEEVKSVMRNTARRLKVKVAKAKWAAMADVAEAACKTYTPRELDDGDHARIARAEEKRQRRADKRTRHAQ
jgi:hypothetical protein